MPSTSTRRRGPAPQQHRPRRPIGRGFAATPAAPARPLQAPFAAVFGVLVAAVDGYLAWLVWDADPGWGWYLLPPGVLLVAALTGAVLVVRGRGLGRVSGAAVLAWASALPLLGLLVLVVFFLALGGGQAAAEAVLLVVAPLGALVLALQRPVREWTRPHRLERAGGRAR